ncbi:MAG: Ig-like domain-containing protein [Lachnospiraceae bacterium]|nr:Ig-like domain-containing protein [Lachnospiraceae bacterium]
MKRILSLIMAAVLLLGPVLPASAAAKYKLNKSKASIEIGETIELKITENGETVSGVTWKSSAPSVAEVDKNGMVTGIAAGEASVTGTFNGVKYKCAVTVTAQTDGTVKRYTVLILDNSTRMKGTAFKEEKAAAETFLRTILKADGKNYAAVVVCDKKGKGQKACKFTSSGKKIAKVLKAQKKCNGKANINSAIAQAWYLLRKIDDGSKVIKNVIICANGLSEKGKENKTGKYSAKDSKKYYKLANRINHSAGVLKDLHYSVYSVGYYQNTSKKHAAFGKRVMKNIASSGKYYTVSKASGFDKVFSKIADSISSAAISRKKLTLEAGSSKTIYVTQNGKTAKPVWDSSDTAIAKVSRNGKVTAVSEGTCTISAVLGNETLRCKVTVQAAAKKKNKTITVSSDLLNIYVGKSKTLTAKVNGKKKKVKWSSKNKSIATVDKNGKVTGVKQGTTKIYAKSGSKKTAVTVKVSVKHPNLSFYILHNPVVSKMGYKKVNESGAHLKVNKGGKVTKCGVYLYTAGGRDNFIIACKGTKLKSIDINCYLGYNGSIVYDSYNTSGHRWYMSRFSMKKGKNGIWSLGGKFKAISFSVEDKNGSNLTASEAGVDSKHIKVFRNLNKMKKWLKK